MTLDKYILTSLLKSVNLYKSAKSASLATSESALVKEGIEILGYSNWENIEQIDELKANYYRIKKYLEEFYKLQEEEDTLIDSLKSEIDYREGSSTSKREQLLSLQEKLQDLIAQRERLTSELQVIKRDSKQLSDLREGLLIDQKNGTLTPERQEKLEKCTQELTELKALHDEKKERFDEITLKIGGQEAEILSYKESLRTNSATDNVGVINQNKELSNNQITQTKIQGELSKLYVEVGTFLYEHSRDRSVRKAIKSQRRILTQIKSISKSVYYHRKLSD